MEKSPFRDEFGKHVRKRLIGFLAIIKYRQKCTMEIILPTAHYVKKTICFKVCRLRPKTFRASQTFHFDGCPEVSGFTSGGQEIFFLERAVCTILPADSRRTQNMNGMDTDNQDKIKHLQNDYLNLAGETNDGKLRKYFD